jgi:hypothetical protein
MGSFSSRVSESNELKTSNINGGLSMQRAIVIMTAGLSAAALIAACGSSSNTPTPTASGSAPTVAVTPTAPPATAPPTTPTPTAASTAAQVAGNWSGSYSGPFNGTFTLTWNQTGSSVNGTIMLSSPADNLKITGTLSGNAISFGAVGVVAYTGTVSGNSMSGSYIDRANGQTGTWSANKS